MVLNTVDANGLWTKVCILLQIQISNQNLRMGADSKVENPHAYICC